MKPPIGTTIFFCYLTCVSTFLVTAMCTRQESSHRPKPDIEMHVQRAGDGWTDVQIYVDCPRGFIYDGTDVTDAVLADTNVPAALASEVESHATCRKEIWSDEYAQKIEEERVNRMGFKSFPSDVLTAHEAVFSWRFK